MEEKVEDVNQNLAACPIYYAKSFVCQMQNGGNAHNSKRASEFIVLGGSWERRDSRIEIGRSRTENGVSKF